MNSMKVVYVAGPFRAKTPWLVEQNIRRAEALALAVWKLGAAALCPHTNTRHFTGEADDEVWLDGTLALMRRCDAVILTPDWATSRGAATERTEAIRMGLPVFQTLEALAAWIGSAVPA